jgi:hypothetical protein
LQCRSGFGNGGVVVDTNAASYTATIQTPGQLAENVHGPAQVTAAFGWLVPSTPPTVTLLNFPSP